MLSRRELIGKAAVGTTAALALGAAARTAVASTRAIETAVNGAAGGRDGRGGAEASVPPAVGTTPAGAAAKTSPPPWHLLKPLGVGSVVAQGWRVADLTPVQDGACVVTLQNKAGRAHRIHLYSNDGSPQGIIYTRRVDLVLMNEGAGTLPTEEGLAQAVAELAHVVAANEGRAADVAELTSHAERLRRYAALEAPAADGKLR